MTLYGDLGSDVDVEGDFAFLIGGAQFTGASGSEVAVARFRLDG